MAFSSTLRLALLCALHFPLAAGLELGTENIKHMVPLDDSLQPSVNDLVTTPKPLSGRRVYKRVCMACHTLEVWGAPKLGNRQAWEARMAKGKSSLYASVINGFNNMPPRGHCQFCTDDELKSAVDYMLSKARVSKNQQTQEGSQ